MGRISIAVLAMCIAACASTAPERPAPTITVTPPSTDAANSPAPDAADLPQTASATPAEGDPNELICRREKEPGSNFTTKICRTRAEIEQRAAEDQAIMETGRRIQTGGSCALNGDC